MGSKFERFEVHEEAMKRKNNELTVKNIQTMPKFGKYIMMLKIPREDFLSFQFICEFGPRSINNGLKSHRRIFCCFNIIFALGSKSMPNFGKYMNIA